MEFKSYSTHAHCEMLDITGDVSAFLTANADKGWKDGFVCVYSPHTTCAVTINEGYDPDVRTDMLAFFSKLVPANWGFRHAEGNSDAHIKTSLMGASCLVPVENGRLALGQWQTVYLCEFDGPRMRRLCFSFVRAE
ncbi:MAG: secondary thiamine-phosphate synthase enzyme YjbQ [Desulfovibrionaceae bacterium]|nr:secondary thiamine-phosphate synthase enzyme YjbQ [Desulfovibrionaceae bacterium]